jgi:hypothetical protein
MVSIQVRNKVSAWTVHCCASLYAIKACTHFYIIEHLGCTKSTCLLPHSLKISMGLFAVPHDTFRTDTGSVMWCGVRHCSVKMVPATIFLVVESACGISNGAVKCALRERILAVCSWAWTCDSSYSRALTNKNGELTTLLEPVRSSNICNWRLLSLHTFWN